MHFMTLKWYCLFIFIVLSACNKSVAPEQPNLREGIDDSIVKYFYYKPGTYWIYKDSITNRIDSIAVLSDVNDSFSGNNGSKSFTTYAVIKIHSCEYNTAGADTVVNNWDWQLVENGLHLNVATSFLVVDQPYTLYSLPLDPSVIQPFLVINGITYYNVEFVVCNSYKSSNDGDTFYINNDVGIVKMRTSHSSDSIYHVWELQRYNMVR